MNTKRKVLIITISVLFAVFLFGTLLSNIICSGYYGGTIVHITEYELPERYTEETNLSEMVSGSVSEINFSGYDKTKPLPSGEERYIVHKITFASPAGVKSVIISGDTELELDALVHCPYLYTGGLIYGASTYFPPESGYIEMRVGDLAIFSYSNGSISNIYCNLRLKHSFSTNPIINIFFASALIAAIVFAFMRKKAKDPFKLLVICSVASAIVSVGFSLFALFKVFLHPDDYRMTIEPIRSRVIDWFGSAVFAVILAALLIMFFRYVKNNGKQKGLKICMLIILIAGHAGLLIHNRIQWEKVDQTFEYSYANGYRDNPS